MDPTGPLTLIIMRKSTFRTRVGTVCNKSGPGHSFSCFGTDLTTNTHTHTYTHNHAHKHETEYVFTFSDTNSEVNTHRHTHVHTQVQHTTRPENQDMTTSHTYTLCE